MEANLSLRDTLTSVMTKLDSYRQISPKLKQPLIEFNKKFNIDLTGKKLNLIIFGNACVGKTTLINHFIKHLITSGPNKVYNFQTKQNMSAPPTSSNKTQDQDEEEEVEEEFDGLIKLASGVTENTYFICLIENSDSEAYEIILEVNNEDDEKALMNIKSLKEKLSNKEYKIKFIFPNKPDEIKKMNAFLEKIDKECKNLIKSTTERDLNDGQKTHQEFVPSRMIIKIPGFPKDYRIIDSPGFSIESFKKPFIKMINDFDFINYFLIVSNVLEHMSYSLTDVIIKEITNDYGSPIIYEFMTKGNEFLQKCPKINKDYREFVMNNNVKIKDLEEMKKKLNFRKIIPINDKEYNEDVKKCLNFFFKDIHQIKEEYGIANFEASVMQRLRRIIGDINDKYSKDLMFSKEQIDYFKSHEEKANHFYEKEIREYFKDLTDDFGKFKEKFPEMLTKLNKVYEKYENKNYHDKIRSRYIDKHAELSFEDFKEIILEKPLSLMETALNQIYEEADEDAKNKILDRLQAEGLINKYSNNKQIGSWLLSFISFVFSRLPIIYLHAHLSSLTTTLLQPFLQLYSLKNVIGFWEKKETREDITNTLIGRFSENNKSKLITYLLQNFKEKSKNIINKLCDCKFLEEWTQDILNECKKIRSYFEPFPDTDYKEELLSLLDQQRLKKFFTKVFDYKEQEKCDDE